MATIAIVVQLESCFQNYFSKLQTPINVAQVGQCQNQASINWTFGFIKRVGCDSVNKPGGPVNMLYIIQVKVQLVCKTLMNVQAFLDFFFFITHNSSLITHHLKYHTRLASSLTCHHSIFFTLFVGPIPVTRCSFFFFFLIPKLIEPRE